ncbi:MAG: MiaB/RimO family radical SAM methylthiotransferase [Planctomycetota bacterium]|nr:MiaB/RimO family radical SAM methylthiotransferase [Planctomycetota bacterium]
MGPEVSVAGIGLWLDWVVILPRHMRTFFIQTLGCKVNHYESEQLATILRSHGLVEADAATADLRIINSCSVTVDAASKSRQWVRRATRLAVLQPNAMPAAVPPKGRTIVTGCWATGDKNEVENLPGVSAVLTHKDDIAQRLGQLLAEWNVAQPAPACSTGEVAEDRPVGMNSLPLLAGRQNRHQRAFLKIQDGCDAHCTYCIIPTLRPTLWSKPIEKVLEEARSLVDAGHRELVLTGIFLGAYGHPTALRRRQEPDGQRRLARLIDALCTQVPGLMRLRLSSLEPGDLGQTLINCLRSHEQVVPHFHLPLQSGSASILRRMNRQYTRDDFLHMVDRVRGGFDRPALTTDIIVGFPGETDEEFGQTIEVATRAGFIHIHAFPFSPRPGTAAARWEEDFVRGPIVGHRIKQLGELADHCSLGFRRSFVGQTVELLVERENPKHEQSGANSRHGRCERYFDVHFETEASETGELVKVRIDQVTQERTVGTLVQTLIGAGMQS